MNPEANTYRRFIVSKSINKLQTDILYTQTRMCISLLLFVFSFLPSLIHRHTRYDSL